MHPQTLRKYERLGLIQPTRTIGSMRVYSRDELERLRLIKHFVDEAGVNLAGVQRLLAIADVVRDMQTRDRRRAVAALAAAPAVRRPASADHSPGALSAWTSRTTTRRSALTKTATDKEIKQAFRKLARKYHPDVNPGRQGGRGALQGDQRSQRGAQRRRQAAQVRRARRQLARLRERPARRAGLPGRLRRLPGPRRRHLHDRQRRAVPDRLAGGDGGAARRQRRRLLRLLHDVLRRRRRGQRRRAADARAQPQPRPAPISSTPCSSRSRRRTTARCAGISLKHDGHTRAIDVRIPAGVRDGARVRVSGEGEPGASGGRAGDLYLRVQVLPHARFERQGDDLTTRVEVPLTTAVLGGEAAVTTLAGTHRPAEGAADDAERPEVPASRVRACPCRASPTNAAISTSSPTCSSPARSRRRRAPTTRRWRSWPSTNHRRRWSP